MKAAVVEPTGRSRRSIGTVDGLGRPISLETIPYPTWLEIVEGDNGYFTYHLTADGTCIADQWFPSLEEAMGQPLLGPRIEPAN